MKTIALVAQKGGTGKSTVTANLAVAALLSGRKVMVLDADPQGSLVDWSRTRRGGAPLVTPVRASAIVTTRYAVERSGLDLMFIDTRCSSLEDSLEAAKAADLTLIVVRPTAVDLRAIAKTVEALKPLGRPAAVVLNQAPSQRTGKEPVIVSEAIDILVGFGLPVAPIGLRHRLIYQAAFAQGLGVMEADPESRAAEEIGDLWDYALSRMPNLAVVERRRPTPVPMFQALEMGGS
jgi:chromosome partitioning protein